MLCDKAILVEGDSDELIVQKAYQSRNDGRLPIEDCIEVISVGTSFLRFLEVAEKIKKPVCVVTDNDGNVEALEKKYDEYLGKKAKDHIVICFDSVVDTGYLTIGSKGFNFNTLEPKLLKANNLAIFNKIFDTSHADTDSMHRYMHSKKTDCALKLFDTTEAVTFPPYITDAIKWLEN